MQGKHYLRITLPGAVLGAIVGYAVVRYGGRRGGATAVERTQ